MKSIFISILIAFFLSSCGIAYHQQLIQEKFPFYPPQIRNSINNHQIILGMDQEMVYLSWGGTFCKWQGFYAGNHVETWGYAGPTLLSSIPNGAACQGRIQILVHFLNGKVIAWEGWNN